MSDFAKISELVTQGQQLLDSIKGGAIRKMETAFDALKSSIASEWNGIKTKMNNEALAAIGRVDTQTVISSLGFTAVNFNGDFLELADIATSQGVNKWPVGMGLSQRSGIRRIDCLSTEIIHVDSSYSVDPQLRPEDAKSLLDFMGIGRNAKQFSARKPDYFQSGFNILKITITDDSFVDLNVSDFDFNFPDCHLKASPASSLMLYYKIVSQAGTMGSLGDNNDGQWHHTVKHFSEKGNVGRYTNNDVVLSGFKTGDVIYFALPTQVTGHWPLSQKHGVLYNAHDYAKQQVNKAG